MFYLVAIPGILLGQSVRASSAEAYLKEKVPASMTVDKSVNLRDRSSDEDALIKLYEQFRRPIHSFTYRLLGSLEDADDVTQEVFVRACSSWDGLYERDNLSSWLYRIASNLCVDLLRRRKRISWWPLSTRSPNSEDGEENPEDISAFLSDNGGIPEIAERELIRHTFARMPEEYSVALVLSAAQGLHYQEVAAIVGLSPNAAATRISRAKKIFAEQYQRLAKDSVGKGAK